MQIENSPCQKFSISKIRALLTSDTINYLLTWYSSGLEYVVALLFNQKVSQAPLYQKCGQTSIFRECGGSLRQRGRKRGRKRGRQTERALSVLNLVYEVLRQSNGTYTFWKGEGHYACIAPHIRHNTRLYTEVAYCSDSNFRIQILNSTVSHRFRVSLQLVNFLVFVKLKQIQDLDLLASACM